jgi:phosphoribosylformylglycinamidine cyclo-ligase
VFRRLAEAGGFALEDAEGTWNLGVGMLAVVDAGSAERVAAALTAAGVHTWRAGAVRFGTASGDGFVAGAKGVDGGAVRLVGAYAS